MPDLASLIYGVCAFVVSGAVLWAAKSLSDLNEKIAVVITTVGFHGKEIERHDVRITKLEDHKA